MLMTILKDDAVNYDSAVWFLKERRKEKCTTKSDCNSFLLLLRLNGSNLK